MAASPGGARFGQFEVGVMSFFPHKEDSWLLGKVEEKNDDSVNVVWVDEEGGVVGDEGNNTHAVSTADLAPVVDGSLDEIRDLIDMPYLHEAVLLHHIRKRYWEDMVYTNIGPIVLAVNPYNFNISHYTNENMAKYIEEKQSALNSGSKQITHLWSVAHEAYWNMKLFDKPQSILVSGESGAGKTEAAKIVAAYLAACSTYTLDAEQKESALAVTRKVVATSPILEAFGNAKTVRNDNSSRFGKFMKIRFSSSGMLQGTYTKHYLLEKSRIVTHAEFERSFHSYYQLAAGASGEERELYQLDHPRIQWIYQGYIPEAEEKEEDAANYREVRKAMDLLGMTEDEQRQVYSCIAGIMHLQGVTFTGEDKAEIDDENRAGVQLVATLFGVPPESLEAEILTTSTTLRGETIVKNLTPSKAVEMRDGLSKSLYERLFSWLIDKINSVLSVEKEDGEEADSEEAPYWIGLLDIFGFENFQVNSLEQFLINLANEQLQNHYNACVFRRDMLEYDREGIDTTTLNPPDNSATLNLLRGKGSLLDHLNDTCKHQSSNDDSFHATVCDEFGPKMGDKSHIPHDRFFCKKIRDGTFGVKHYASDVSYNVDGFKEKNLDTLKDSFKVLMRGSEMGLIATLLPAPEEDTQGPKKGGKKTTANGFRISLDSLLQLIDMTNPHWIRCVKPHSAKKAKMFSGVEVIEQLRCAGVLETIKIRQSGYSMRVPFPAFWRRFCIIIEEHTETGTEEELLAACQKLLDSVCTRESQEGQLGKTKVFLKDAPYKLLEKKRDAALESSCKVIQGCARARLSVGVRYNMFLMAKTRQVQAFARSKTSMHQRYYHDLKCKIISIQAHARAKQSSGVRAQMDLLRMCRLVQAHARSKESSRVRAVKHLQSMARDIVLQAQWKVSSHTRYYRQLSRHAAVINGFAQARESEKVLRQKEYEHHLRLTAAATALQQRMRDIASSRLVACLRTQHHATVIQSAVRSHAATLHAAHLQRCELLQRREEAYRQHHDDTATTTIEQTFSECTEIAERIAQAEEEARLEAERIAREEEEARLEAERIAKEEEEARLAAEAAAEAEAKAQAEAEAAAKAKAEEEAAEEERRAAAAEAEAARLAAEEAAAEAQRIAQNAADEESRAKAEEAAAAAAALAEEAAAAQKTEAEATQKAAELQREREEEEAAKAAEMQAEKAAEAEAAAAAAAAQKAEAESAETQPEEATEPVSAPETVPTSEAAPEKAAEAEAVPEREVEVEVETKVPEVNGATHAEEVAVPKGEGKEAVHKEVVSAEQRPVAEQATAEVPQQSEMRVAAAAAEAPQAVPKEQDESAMLSGSFTESTPARMMESARGMMSRVWKGGAQVTESRELDERKRQLENMAAQLSQVLNEVGEWQRKAETAEQKLEEERVQKRKLEQQLMLAQEKLAFGPNAHLGKEDPGHTPEAITNSIEYKKTAIRMTRGLLEKREQELLQLEKRKIFADPIQTAEFHEMVTSRAEDIIKKACAKDTKAKGAATEYTIQHILDALQKAHARLAGVLPRPVVESLHKILTDMRDKVREMQAPLNIPCLTKAESLQAVEPLLLVLNEVGMAKSTISALSRPVDCVSPCLTDYNTYKTHFDTSTSQDSARHSRMRGELKSAREQVVTRMSDITSFSAEQPDRFRRVGAVKLEQNVLRSHIKAHRLDRDESLAKIKVIESAHEAYEADTRQMLKQEQEVGEDIHKRINETKAKLSSKQRDMEKEKAKLAELEIGLAQNQKQSGFYHEFLKEVEHRITGEKTQYDGVSKDLQMVAFLKVKQLLFLDNMEVPLLESLEGDNNDCKRVSSELARELLLICEAEWDCSISMHNQEIRNYQLLQEQLNREEQELSKVGDTSSSTPTKTGLAKFAAAIPGLSPNASQKQKKKTEVVASQLKQSFQVLFVLKRDMNVLAELMKQHPEHFPPETLAQYDVDALPWPMATATDQE